MNDWLRSHARWLGGAVIVVLAAGMAYVLRAEGSADAQAGSRGSAQVRAIAPVLAPAARRGTGRARSRSAGSTGPQAATATARRSGPRPGLPTPAPSRQGVSQALRQATGLSPDQVTSRRVCGRPAPGHATCAAERLVLRTTGAPVRPRVANYRSLGRVKPALTSGAHPASVAAATPPTADTPAYLQQAYDLSYLSQTAGTGDTVAVVDAFDDPTAASDLGTFRSKYSLPACTT